MRYERYQYSLITYHQFSSTRSQLTDVKLGSTRWTHLNSLKRNDHGRKISITLLIYLPNFTNLDMDHVLIFSHSQPVINLYVHDALRPLCLYK